MIISINAVIKGVSYGAVVAEPGVLPSEKSAKKFAKKFFAGQKKPAKKSAKK